MARDRSGTLTGQRLGPYQLVSKLGQGGMGAVYKARDISLQRTVAVKVLPTALAADQTYVRRFVREARASARLSHPNLVHIYHVGQKEGLYYFAMEFIAGQSLFGRIRTSGPLTVEEFLRIGGQTLAALQKIHSAGLTHRDVKSSNVIIETGTGRAVLMDFGLAKDRSARADEPALTSAGVVLGTPEYMSPEQAEGRKTDARSDIYSLGIMAHEMLTGRMPFTGKSAIAVLRQQVEAAPPPLSAGRPELPPALDAIVARALAKTPDERYGSAALMAADLVRVGHTAELAELAAAGLPATARTIVTPMTASGPAPGAPTVPTVRQHSVRRQPSKRQIAMILGGAALLGVLLAVALLGAESCREGPQNGKPPVVNGGKPPVVNGVKPPPAKPEPGRVGQLVPRGGGAPVRVRILNIEGTLAEVQELDAEGRKVGGPVKIDLSQFGEFRAAREPGGPEPPGK